MSVQGKGYIRRPHWKSITEGYFQPEGHDRRPQTSPFHRESLEATWDQKAVRHEVTSYRDPCPVNRITDRQV